MIKKIAVVMFYGVGSFLSCFLLFKYPNICSVVIFWVFISIVILKLEHRYVRILNSSYSENFVEYEVLINVETQKLFDSHSEFRQNIWTRAQIDAFRQKNKEALSTKLPNFFFLVEKHDGKEVFFLARVRFDAKERKWKTAQFSFEQQNIPSRSRFFVSNGARWC